MKEEKKFDIKKEDYFVAWPTDAGNRFHIFSKESKRSLCNRVAMPFVKLPDDSCTELTEVATLQKGDCKSCWKKAGLVKEVKKDGVKA